MTTRIRSERAPRRVRVALLGAAVAVALGGAPSTAEAQSEEEAVLATVERLFDAMARRDTVALRAVLTPEGRFASVLVAGDSVVLGGTSHDEFVDLVGGAPAPLIERMWDPRVFLAGPFAAVWAPYDFHRGDAFSHCGTDVFTLVRIEGGWKINGASYTVVRDPCPPAPAGAPEPSPTPATAPSPGGDAPA